MKCLLIILSKFMFIKWKSVVGGRTSKVGRRIVIMVYKGFEDVNLKAR